MQDVSFVELAKRAEWVLSILPPSQARAFAEQYLEAYKGAANASASVSVNASSGAGGARASVTFADCNAVSPQTVQSISALFAGTSIRFIDAGIIGGPPKDAYDPVFYASAAPQDAGVLDAFEGLSKYGLKVSPLRGEGAGVGDASALKMSYAVRILHISTRSYHLTEQIRAYRRVSPVSVLP